MHALRLGASAASGAEPKTLNSEDSKGRAPTVEGGRHTEEEEKDEALRLFLGLESGGC